MKDNDKNLIAYIIILALFLFFGLVGYLTLKEIEDLKIDHQCYMMSDEEFFQIEMCKPYWKYRRNK